MASCHHRCSLNHLQIQCETAVEGVSFSPPGWICRLSHSARSDGCRAIHPWEGGCASPRRWDEMVICLDGSGNGCLVLFPSLLLVVQPRGTLGEKHHGEAFRDTASTLFWWLLTLSAKVSPWPRSRTLAVRFGWCVVQVAVLCCACAACMLCSCRSWASSV